MPSATDKDLSRNPSSAQAAAGGLAAATPAAASPAAAGSTAAAPTTGLLGAAAATAAYVALLALIVRAQRKFKVAAIAAVYPDLTGPDLDRVTARELELDAAFAANARTRLRRDVDQVFQDEQLAKRARQLAKSGASTEEIARDLGISNAKAAQLLSENWPSRRQRMKTLLERERRFLQMHIEASKRRMRHESEARRIEAESVDGAVWILGKARNHTRDCEIMAGGREGHGLFWGWDVLRIVNPANRHTGCECHLASPAEARRRGVAFKRGVMTPAMWREVTTHTHESATADHVRLRGPRVADLRDLGYTEGGIVAELVAVDLREGNYKRIVHAEGVALGEDLEVGPSVRAREHTSAGRPVALALAELLESWDVVGAAPLTDAPTHLPGLHWAEAGRYAIAVAYVPGSLREGAAAAWRAQVQARRDLVLLNRSAEAAAELVTIMVYRDGAIATNAPATPMPAALANGLRDGTVKASDSFREGAASVTYLGALDGTASGSLSDRDRSILEAARAIAAERSDSTFGEIGAAHGVTQARVSQIVAKWNETHPEDQIAIGRRRRRR